MSEASDFPMVTKVSTLVANVTPMLDVSRHGLGQQKDIGCESGTGGESNV